MSMFPHNSITMKVHVDGQVSDVLLTAPSTNSYHRCLRRTTLWTPQDIANKRLCWPCLLRIWSGVYRGSVLRDEIFWRRCWLPYFSVSKPFNYVLAGQEKTLRTSCFDYALCGPVSPIYWVPARSPTAPAKTRLPSSPTSTFKYSAKP